MMMIKESLNVGFRFATRPAATALAVRNFTGNTKKLDEKEKGDEQIFFKRQEGKRSQVMRINILSHNFPSMRV